MKLKITMFADYIWPYCFIGKGLVEKMKDKYDFEIETLGFEIHPETPAEGKSLNEVFPGFENQLKPLQELGKSKGVEINQLTMLYNTNKALRVGELAKDKGVGNEFAELMYKAYFTECLDISSDEVLVAKGKLLNLTENQVLEALKNKTYIERLNDSKLLGRKFKVSSVPTFIINDEYKVVGSDGQAEIAKIFDQLLKK